VILWAIFADLYLILNEVYFFENVLGLYPLRSISKEKSGGDVYTNNPPEIFSQSQACIPQPSRPPIYKEYSKV
jgi:hypothetical protein